MMALSAHIGLADEPSLTTNDSENPSFLGQSPPAARMRSIIIGSGIVI
jgi:hypothetical protein